MVKQGDKRENIVFLSVGTNLGDRFLNILGAEEALRQLSTKDFVKSRVYESEPWGNNTLAPFLNSVVCLTTVLQPLELLLKTQQVEKDIGRSSKSEGQVYENRIIDIDILVYNNLTYNSSSLTIPHPYISKRNFVLQPFAECAPAFKLPYSQYTITELAEKCKDPLRCSSL